ncbi:MAG: lysophospholipid acyltransferase family protein [Planctomycetes bacterium]|nr:lysophospholipid acyltransferase family protein [Planctomycetota bacterium]
MTLRRRARAAALSAMRRGAGLLPDALAFAGLRGAARLARFTRFEARTLANLERVYGAELDAPGRRALASAVRLHAARQVHDWLRLARTDPADPRSGRWIEDEVTLDESFAIYEREAARGRGVLIVTAHLGDWELLAARLARAGVQGSVVGYERANDPAARFFARMRERNGLRTIRQQESAREALTLLRAGGALGILTDLEVKRLHGEFVPFLGHAALTLTAPAALARASGLPLLPAVCSFDEREGRWRLRFEEPLALETGLERHAARTRLLERQNQVFGRWIRAQPEQWAWHQPRWRTRPQPSPTDDLYKALMKV